jgi:hypothetical protein
MRAFGFKGLLCAGLLAAAQSAYPATITFFGALSGANENPATGSPGTGTALVTFDSTTQMLGVDVTFSGLEGPTTASHIHCCVAPGGNAGVATAVPSFPGFPLGVTAGTYVNTFDLTQLFSYNPAFVAASGGNAASAEAALVAGLENGMAYLNIHTSVFPGGEIRAFLQPVPEPFSASLMLSGLGVLWTARRRHTRHRS